MSLHVIRKRKTLTPDDEKDGKYWEKRMRNNMAAKKSRENKRHVETAIRQKVSELEKENILLRRELSQIKVRFGIPENQCLLTMEDREECNKLAEDMSSPALSPLNSVGNDFFSSRFAGELARKSCSSSAPHGFPDVYGGGYDPHDPHGSISCHSTTSSDEGAPPSDGGGIVYVYDKPKLTPPRIINSAQTALDLSESTYVVRDLSIKKRHTEYNADLGDNYHSNDKCAPHRAMSESHENRMVQIRKYAEESDSSDLDVPNREDLKCKLEALSEQVQSMYKYVYESK